MDQMFEKINDTCIKYNGKLYRKTGLYYRRCDGHSINTYLHRKVYEDFYGKIPSGYVVHHKDGNKENNSPDNLEAMPKGKHSTLHHTGLIASKEARAKMSAAAKIRHSKSNIVPIPSPYSF